MKKLWQILRRGSVLVTGILIVLYLFSLTLPAGNFGIGPSVFFLILGFSMVVSLAQEIFSIKKMPLFARYSLHFAALLASFIVLYLLSGNYKLRGPSSFFSAIVLFIFGYAIVALPVAMIRAKMKSNAQKNAPSQYKKIYK